MTAGRTALTALAIVVALGGASLGLAQALPALTLGAASTVQIPVAPAIPVTVAAAGEYQLDAAGGTADAELTLVLSDAVVAHDSDSGDGEDARIIAFLVPGTYAVNVSERGGRPLSARVSIALAPPMAAVASITPGAPPSAVSVAAATSARDSSAEVTLTVTEADTYQLDVSSAELDAELQLIHEGAVMAADSSSGGDRNARLALELSPGAYTLRVRDSANRAGALTVQAAPL